MTTNTDDICEKYLELTNAASASLYRDKWICDESLLRLLISNYPNLKGTLRSSVVGKLRTITGRFDSSNTNRLYSAKFKVLCPVEQSVRRNVHFWYRGSEDKPPPPAPKRSSDVACAFANSPSVKRDTIRTNTVIRDLLKSQQPKNANIHLPHCAVAKNVWIRQRNKQRNERNERNERMSLTRHHRINHLASFPKTPMKFHPKTRTTMIGNAVSSESPVDGGDGGSNISVDVVNIGEDRIPIYWESPEAAKLFGFNYEEGELCTTDWRKE